MGKMLVILAHACFPKRLSRLHIVDIEQFQAATLSLALDAIFLQLVRLDHIPHSLSAEVVDTGVEITILGVHGSPLMYDGVIQDPFQAERYQVILRSLDDIEIRTEIGLHTENAKIWFQELE